MRSDNMECPDDRSYTEEHEWILVKDKVAKVGITEFAQSELGEIVFVELPEIGTELQKGETLCVVESTKAASDVYCPVAGKVKSVNVALNDSPGLINSAPFGEGWLVELEEVDTVEVESLMDSAAYEEHVS